MKICCLAVGLGAALPLVGAPLPTESSEPIIAHRANRALSADQALLPVGTPRAVIRKELGVPDLQLSPNAWVYWHRTTNRPELSAGFDTLVILFKADRVSDMKIVAEAPIRQYAAALAQRNPAATLTPLVAAK